jgi:hypothetical protein
MIMGYVFRLTLLYGYIRMARFYVSRVGELPNYYSPGERYNEDGGQIGYVPPSTRWWVPSIFRGRTKKRVGKKLKSLAKRLKEQRNYEEELNLLGAAYPEAPNIYAPSSNNLREKALENAKAQENADRLLNEIYGITNNENGIPNDPMPHHSNDPEPLSRYGGTRRRPRRRNRRKTSRR